MNIQIGKNQKQKEGFSAFIPHPFPPKGIFELSPQIIIKASQAEHLVGKLDGITDPLPDVDFFLKMFVFKDATASSQIEGTKATMVDAIEQEVGVEAEDTDADDILHYTLALNYGMKRLKKFPFSLRLIREIHAKLLTEARSSHYADPGEFRKSQNWIGGTTPANASYVPPTVSEMNRSLTDWEKFLHSDNQTLSLIQAALMHAQFETIHPFLDGNGRTGRLLITLLLCQKKLLEKPVLFLSTYFKKHQKVYYEKLNNYHEEGKVEEWIDFFLDGVIEIANESIKISKKIRKLRDDDMGKISALAKRESESGVLVLSNLFAQPIVNSKKIMEWTGFSTRSGALRLLERFVDIGILEPRDESETYDKTYIYRRYLKMFL